MFYIELVSSLRYTVLVSEDRAKCLAGAAVLLTFEPCFLFISKTIHLKQYPKIMNNGNHPFNPRPLAQ